MKKMLSIAILGLSFMAFASSATASQNGLPNIGWDDTAQSVAAKNNQMQEGNSLDKSNQTFFGTPKDNGGFLGMKPASPYQYNFFNKKLFSVTITLNTYTNNKPETVKRSIADYNSMKAKIEKEMGIKPEATESTEPDQPFFACIYDENCGVYGASFATKDSNITLFMSGSEAGDSNQLMLTISKKD